MIVYIAGFYRAETFEAVNFNFNHLDSFLYIKKNPKIADYINRYKRFMLDSGAYTFIISKKANLDIDSYTDEYIDFISHYNIDLFFEMDVDIIFGYEKVKKLRDRIEQRVGKPTIPVFHMIRGINEFKAMCKDYSYIAIAGKEFRHDGYKSAIPFINEARKHNCKVHGLGITGMDALRNIPFYSVDSTTWLNGNRFGAYFEFKNGIIKPVSLPNKKIINRPKLTLYNLKTWIKFADYMEEKLINF